MTNTARMRCLAHASCLVLILAASFARPSAAGAQDEVSAAPQGDTTVSKPDPNTTAGEFTPSRGFDLVKTERGSLNISLYALFRYLNQLPRDSLFTDHLGRFRVLKARNDLNWHRTMVWLSGFFYTKRFRYTITLWSLPTTQQTLLFGTLQYHFNRAVNAGVGILPNLTARSMQGSWPYWGGSDRQMAEDFFRAGFSSGVFLSGEPIPRVYYTLSINNNLSQLGVTAPFDTRQQAYSASVFTLPTTGEFGPRGGFGDLEYHTRVATRFGASAGHAREGRFAPDSLPPNETQIRLSDGVSPFETGALADGVTINKLDYDLLAIDAAVKYRGFSFQGEYYFRKLSDFLADGPLPEDEVFDHGFMAQAMYMFVPHTAGVFVSSGYIFDDFDREPWELGGGVSVYPSHTRSWRLNLYIMRVNQSPAGSNFGYYAAGMTGTIFSLGTDILF